MRFIVFRQKNSIKNVWYLPVFYILFKISLLIQYFEYFFRLFCNYLNNKYASGGNIQSFYGFIASVFFNTLPVCSINFYVIGCYVALNVYFSLCWIRIYLRTMCIGFYDGNCVVCCGKTMVAPIAEESVVADRAYINVVCGGRL